MCYFRTTKMPAKALPRCFKIQNHFSCYMAREVVAKTTEIPVMGNWRLFPNSACSKIIFLSIWILLHLTHLSFWKENTKNQDSIRLVLGISSGPNGQEESENWTMDMLLFQGLYLHKLTCIFYNISGPYSATICLYILLYTSEYSHRTTSDDSHHNY